MTPLALYCQLQSRWLTMTAADDSDTRDPDSEAGQASAEYALVLLGAAAVAMLLIGWATKSDRIGKLLDSVLDKITGNVK